MLKLKIFPLRIALSILSASFLVISFPDFNLWLLAWIALVPLFFALEGQRLIKAFITAYIAGVIFFFGTVYWLVHVTLPGMIITVLYLALYVGAFGLIASSAINNPSYFNLFAISAIWTVLEYARSHVFSGFGWNLLAHSQSSNLVMIQISDIVGGYGVSFLVILVNTAIFFTIKDAREGKRHRLFAAITITTLFLAASYGTLRLNNIFTGERLKVAVIQGNIAQEKKWDPAFRKMIMDKYEALTRRAAKDAPDLIIWPETSVPGFLYSEKDLFDRVSGLAKSTRIPLLVGEPRQELTDDNIYYNSATLFDEDGKALTDYDKVHLVPFGEFIPLKRIFSFVEKFTKSTIGDFSPGKEYTVFTFTIERNRKDKNYNWKLIKKVRFSALICFEDIFPEIARRFVQNGAGFLVNITNDAWFGRSSAPYQHLQNSVFRAIENRVNVIRAANSGVSCFIDQKGHVYGMVSSEGRSIFVEGIKVDEIVLTRTRTLYTIYGDVFAYLCVLVVLLYFILDKHREALPT